MDARREQDYSEGWVSWRAIKLAATRPTLWLATWALLTLAALALALPWQAWFAESTAHRYAPGELIGSLTETFRFDHARALGQLDQHTAQTGALLALAAVLCGIFAAGGWLSVLLEPAGDVTGPRLRRFFTGGARYFWRNLRVWLVVVVLLAGWYWVVYDEPFDNWVLGRWLRIPEADRDSLESLQSELHVAALGWARDGIFWLGYALVLCCATYARTRLACFARYSALGAFAAALGTILRHPVRTLRPFVALFLFELLLVGVALGWSVRGLETQLADLPSWSVVLALFLIGQLAVLLRELARGARYAAALDVLRALRPGSEPARGEPRPSLGAPGGPQYPLDDDLSGDEFGATV